jgi:hypothetical protein
VRTPRAPPGARRLGWPATAERCHRPGRLGIQVRDPVGNDTMDHDQNFKNLILDYPREALAFFAAEEAGGIAADTRIVPLREEQTKERLGERFRELDTPLLVEWADGQREVLLFVLEEETESRRFDIYRLGQYCLDLAKLLATHRLVPVVIFLRAGHVPHELTLGGDRHTYMHFRYLPCHLADIPYEHYRDSDNIVARLNLPNMRCVPEQRVDVYAQALRGLRALEPDPERRLKYVELIDSYVKLDDNEWARFQRDYPQEDKAMSGFAERFRQEGMEMGAQQGEARVLMRQLQAKFGALPDAVRARVEAADESTLLLWSERVLTARRIDEVVH